MSLRKKLIRLAHANPDLRDDLLPLIKEGSAVRYQVAKMTSTEVYETLDELLSSYDQTGTARGGRPELQGQPKLRGLYGPFYNGSRNGVTTIRYETKGHYMSND